MTTPAWRSTGLIIAAIAMLCSAGCIISTRRVQVDSVQNMAKELHKSTLPEHMIEPPDVLQIDLIAAVPKPPYKLQPLDAITLKADGVLDTSPISGTFQIDTDGTVNLGSNYGVVFVSGKTVAEAKEAILAVLKETYAAPSLEIALAQTRGMQQIRGPHLVRPDGTVWFDIYGAVRVVGMTLPQARKAIEDHLSQFFLDPEVAVSITGYNSKVYYIIMDIGFEGGAQIMRAPVTGNETVLDAIGQIGGLTPIADYKRIWIARPAPEGCEPQILPIDWQGITELAKTDTNYQIFPGDRIFVKAAPAVSAFNRFDRLIAPLERMMGFTLLGVGTYQQIKFINQPFGFGGFGGAPIAP